MSGFQPYEIIVPQSGLAGENIVVIADHASNHVPEGIDLGVPADVMGQHVAIDMGAAGVTRPLGEALGRRRGLARV
ncbi:MAG: N-formylglutamate amidohydrolase, partial [Blastomonas sp.]|nr:N-formylglutamate amidohydrolase [Blastomonas sp.]